VGRLPPCRRTKRRARFPFPRELRPVVPHLTVAQKNWPMRPGSRRFAAKLRQTFGPRRTWLARLPRCTKPPLSAEQAQGSGLARATWRQSPPCLLWTNPLGLPTVHPNAPNCRPRVFWRVRMAGLIRGATPIVVTHATATRAAIGARDPDGGEIVAYKRASPGRDRSRGPFRPTHLPTNPRSPSRWGAVKTLFARPDCRRAGGLVLVPGGLSWGTSMPVEGGESAKVMPPVLRGRTFVLTR